TSKLILDAITQPTGADGQVDVRFPSFTIKRQVSAFRPVAEVAESYRPDLISFGIREGEQGSYRDRLVPVYRRAERRNRWYSACASGDDYGHDGKRKSRCQFDGQRRIRTRAAADQSDLSQIGCIHIEKTL